MKDSVFKEFDRPKGMEHCALKKFDEALENIEHCALKKFDKALKI